MPFFTICLLAWGINGQGYVLEWELKNLTRPPYLPSYIPTNGVSLGAVTGDQFFPFNIGKEFDLEDDGIPEILVPEDSSGSHILKNIKIYDGATHSLKYTVHYNFPGKEFRIGFNWAFFDVDGDKTKELIHFDASAGYITNIYIINVQNNTIEFEVDSVFYGPYGIYDLDNDGSPELWFVKFDPPESRQFTLYVYGSGPSGVNPSSPRRLNKQVARLMNNAPNPFTTSTRIEYYVPAAQHVQLNLFDAEGKLLRVLVDASQRMGEYSVVWDGKSDKGKKAATGAYYYQLRIGEFLSSKKMILLK